MASLAYPILRTGKVISNEDPDKQFKCQMRILPELVDVAEADLPWVRPFSQGSTGTKTSLGSCRVPEKDSFVRVLVLDESWQESEYLPAGENIPGLTVRKYLEDNLKIDGYTLPAYPQPSIVDVTAEGSILFHDTKTGDLGLQHASGLFVWIKASGELSVKYLKKVTLIDKNAATSLTLDADTGLVTVKASKFRFDGDEFQVGSGADNIALFKPLAEVLNEIIKAKTVSPVGPTTPLVDSSLAPLAGKLASKIQQIKSVMHKTS